MSQETYQSVVLAKRPESHIIAGETFALKTNPIITANDLKDGQVLLETIYLSLEPAMRAWLQEGLQSYHQEMKIGDLMSGIIIAKVLASKSPSFTVGQHVTTMAAGWVELAIVDAKEVTPMQLPEGSRLTDALGALGPTGLTAYFGMTNVAQVKAGDFVVVSGAAGATGSIACQIALIKGAKVLAIAGTADKVKWLKELGCDALNYKDADFAKKFEEKTKNLIDVFFDNVGGEVLDLALRRAKTHARFAICGAISLYNTGDPVVLKNYMSLILKRIRMEAFLIFDYAEKFPAASKELSQWLVNGKLQRKETIIKGGLAAAEQALIDLYKGINTGKLLVQINEEN